MAAKEPIPLIPSERIEQRIFFLRGHKVMLDRDLAKLYGVSTKRLNEQVKRNRARFPEDFIFRLAFDEANAVLALRSQIATFRRGAHLKYAPYAFTEHGALMAATVLNSPVAVEMSISVVRAFVNLRRLAASHAELAKRLNALEQGFGKHDEEIQTLFKAIRQLLAPPSEDEKKNSIGFQPSTKEK